MSYLPRKSYYIKVGEKLTPGIAKILNNMGWLAFDKAMRIVLGLLIGAWVARFLGPKSLGELAYITAFVGLFQTAAQLGLDNIAIRDINRQPELAKEIVSTIFRLRIASGLFCYCAAIYVMYLLRPNDGQSLLLVSIFAGVLVFQSSDTVDIWFQSKLQSKRTVLSKLISYGLSSVIKIALILMSAPLVAFAVVFLLEAVFSALALLYSYRKYKPNVEGCFQINRAKNLLANGFPFLISGVVLTSYMQLDRVLLGDFVGLGDVGYYAAALSISGAFNFIPMIVGMSFAPKMSVIQNEYERSIFFINLNAFLIWVSIFFAVVIFFAADFIILFLYGADFYSSALILKVQALGLIPVFLSVGNDYLALNLNKGRVSLLRVIAGFSVNLGLNVLLIPRYGALGAAISGVLAHWFSNTIFYWLIMKGALLMHIKAAGLPLRIVYVNIFLGRAFK